MPKRSPNGKRRVALLGAALGTGNLGVDALGAATVQGLGLLPGETEVFYQSWTDDPVEVRLADRVERCQPLVVRRRSALLQHDSVSRLRQVAAMRQKGGNPLAGLLGGLSKTWKALQSCDAVLDLSAGDSFAEVYGEEVFWYQSQVKLMCLDMGLPLVLMPQTLGPFNSDEARSVAAEILSHSAIVGTREAACRDEIHQLCPEIDPERVVLSPDVAFLLAPAPLPLPDAAEEHLAGDNGPLIAVNVSGLLYFGNRDFGLRADQAEVAIRLVRWALAKPNTRVLLVPHVVPAPGAQVGGAPTSDRTDNAACHDLLGRLTDQERGRVDFLEGVESPATAKHAMARCHFFVGARMHAYIGASSQATPGALLAYSKKATGTTSTLGIDDAVVDLRELDADAVIAEVDRRYDNRDATAARLREIVPEARQRIARFFTDDLARLLDASRTDQPTETAASV
ncbi:MAG: polysaccharide pyruvyl transferase family protein [Planctomycetota bacterium]